MTFGQAIKSVLTHYATFEGRARRSEYWWWYLLNAIIIAGGYLLVGIFTLIGYASYSIAVIGFAGFLTFLLYAWILFAAIPSLAVQFRRLHDTDRSGWYWALNIVPVAGLITLIVLLARPGSTTKNEYGNAVTK